MTASPYPGWVVIAAGYEECLCRKLGRGIVGPSGMRSWEWSCEDQVARFERWHHTTSPRPEVDNEFLLVVSWICGSFRCFPLETIGHNWNGTEKYCMGPASSARVHSQGLDDRESEVTSTFLR